MSALSSLSVDERIAKFIQVYQWLRGASQERLLSRKHLHFQAVHPFADSMSIVDISAHNAWQVRLSGTQVCERLGRDTTGCDAQARFTDKDREIRSALAHRLFELPCAIRAVTRETYNNGAQALIDSIALPLEGAEGQRLVVHYAQVIEDIEHSYRRRPVARRSDLVSYTYVDLGYGIPSFEDLRLRA